MSWREATFMAYRNSRQLMPYLRRLLERRRPRVEATPKNAERSGERKLSLIYGHAGLQAIDRCSQHRRELCPQVLGL